MSKGALIQHNPDGVFPPYRAYSHAIEITAGSRLLFISGLNGYESDGTTILKDAAMDLSCLVSLRFYLADPKYDEANVRMRVKYLGSHRPALTVVCCRLLEPQWKLEVEAVAAR